MDLHLTGKTVIVAGSSRGIGRAIAYAFLTEGAHVAVTGRQVDSLQEATATFTTQFGSDRILSHAGDLSQPEVVESLLEKALRRWGHIDCLVANIGRGASKPGWQVGQEEWGSSFTVNLWASVRLAEAVLPYMIKAGQGNIIFITSIAGLEYIGAPLPYGAAKAALVHYSKGLSRKVGPHGVRVNCVAPGNILFVGGTWERRLREQPEVVRKMLETEVTLVRFGAAEEVADLTMFLASDRAAFITGACVVIDGGQTRGR